MKRFSRTWRLVLAGAVLVGAAGATWWFLDSTASRTVVLSVGLQDPKVLQALNQEVQNFQSLNPTVNVTLVKPGTPGPAPDAALLSSYPADAGAWVFPLTPWSGNLWVLAAHKARLDRIAVDDASDVAALRSGILDSEGFVRLLTAAKALGPAPLTLGNSHLWPYLVWLQAWTAATVGPQVIGAVPVAVNGVYAEFQPAMETLNRWRASGWFDAQAWPLGWAQGVGPLEHGQAVFALISEPLLGALSPTGRGALEFLPFPHRKQDPPWNLGSAQFLALSATSPRKTEAATLVHYLTSPGVTSRLAQVTGRPFFAWNQTDQRSPMVLPDWVGRINDPAVRGLAEALVK